MTPPAPFAHDCVILDACCIINLYASGHMEALLRAVPRTVAVAAYVHEEEALYIVSADDESTDEQIDLQPLVERGLLLITRPETEAENAAFITFAAALGDDGEAVTGAIAVQRNWAIGTDDRAAIRFFRRVAPHTQIISSLELVRYWAEQTAASTNEVKQVLRRIRQCGRYFPHKNHILYTWWQSHFENAV